MLSKYRNTRQILRLIALAVAVLILVAAIPLKTEALEQPSALRASGAILVDADTGRVLYEQNADLKIAPASTTKILTALLVIEAAERGEISLNDKIVAKQSIIDGVMWDASRVSPYIADGEVLTVEQYLYCVLLSSDCVACDILANYVSGSVEAFVAEMNERAAELSCTDTNFVNTHGYPDDNHYTTVRSLYLITNEAIKHEQFNEIFGTIKYRVEETNLGNTRMLYNTDWMLWNPEKIESIYTKYYYEYTLGGKTGTSESSGHCLASYAEKNGVRLICVLTGAKITTADDGSSVKESFTESERLYEWGFNNWSMQTVLHSGDIMYNQPVSGGKRDSVDLYLTDSVSALLPNGTTSEQLRIEFKLNNEIAEAPIAAFEQLGAVEVYYGDELIDTVPIAAQDAVEKKGIGAMGVVLLILGLGLILAAGGWYVYTTYFVGREPAAYSAKRNGAARAARYSSGGLSSGQSADYTGYRSRIPQNAQPTMRYAGARRLITDEDRRPSYRQPDEQQYSAENTRHPVRYEMYDDDFEDMD